MSLNQRERTARDINKFPTTQLFLLAFVRLAEPIAITSIFPYAWKLVLDFHVGNKSNASFYAGILISTFSFAESLTGMFWGGVSDRIGRKPVLLMGCIGTILSLLVVGLSTNFWVALFGRALGGLLNGNIGVVQTMVGEITVNPKHEPRAYAVMPFVWSIGTIIGPAIGGLFSTPAENFPDIFSSTGVFAKYPFLLPNVVCAGLMLLSIIAGYFFLEETHPDMQPWSTTEDSNHTHAETPLIPAQASINTAAADLRTESYGTFNKITQDEEEHWHVRADGRSNSVDSADNDKVFTRRVIMLTVALGLFTYHSMTYDHLLPIFLQDERFGDNDFTAMSDFASVSGGLGLSLRQVGVIMSVNGMIALFIQAIIFPIMAAWIGIWKLFMLVTILHPTAYMIMPYLTLLSPHWLYAGIYSCLTIRNIYGIMAYPTLLILLKEAAPSSSCLGKINGLAASTGAACRTIASPIAGLLYGFGAQIGFTGLAWWASALVAVVGTIQAFFINRKKTGAQHHVYARGARCSLVPAEQPPRHVVHIVVHDTHGNITPLEV